MSHQKLLQQMIGVTLVALVLIGCSAPAATPTPVQPKDTTVTSTRAPADTSTPRATATCTHTPTPIPTSTPTPTPVPTTGSVEGRLIGRDTHQPLAGAFIVLCEITGDFTCTLHADLTATADEEGWFTVGEVPPGEYTVAYAEAENSAAVSFEDGFSIAVPFKVLEGSLRDNNRGLSFEFREERFLGFEARLGEATKVEIAAWGL